MITNGWKGKWYSASGHNLGDRSPFLGWTEHNLAKLVAALCSKHPLFDWIIPQLIKVVLALWYSVYYYWSFSSCNCERAQCIQPPHLSSLIFFSPTPPYFPLFLTRSLPILFNHFNSTPHLLYIQELAITSHLYTLSSIFPLITVSSPSRVSSLPLFLPPNAITVFSQSRKSDAIHLYHRQATSDQHWHPLC